MPQLDSKMTTSMVEAADDGKLAPESVCSEESWDCVDCLDDSASERCTPAPEAVPTCLHGHVPGSSPRGRRAGSVLSYMCAFVRRHALGLLAGAVVTLGCVVAVQQQRIRWLSSTAASAAADAEIAAANAARLEQVAKSLYESYKNASGEARGAQAQLRRAQVLVGEMQQQYTAALGRPLTCLASVFGWRSRRHVWLD